MKKILVLIVSLVFLLCGCAQQQSNATPVPTKIIISTPNTAMSTPTTGYVSVRKLEGMQALLLHSQPDSKSPISGQVAPGDKGKVMGLNAAQNWALLKFEQQTGWAPVAILDLVIAQ
jgi:hypothetical protein